MCSWHYSTNKSIPKLFLKVSDRLFYTHFLGLPDLLDCISPYPWILYNILELLRIFNLIGIFFWGMIRILGAIILFTVDPCSCEWGSFSARACWDDLWRFYRISSNSFRILFFWGRILPGSCWYPTWKSFQDPVGIHSGSCYNIDIGSWIGTCQFLMEVSPDPVGIPSGSYFWLGILQKTDRILSFHLGSWHVQDLMRSCQDPQ